MKLNTVAYINRNCGAMNRRNEIVKELMSYYNVTAYGCLGKSERADKGKVFGQSKFCKSRQAHPGQCFSL